MKPNYLNGKQALLLDMNSTFMFDEDRFGEGMDYSLLYKKLGGKLSDQQVNQLIQRCYRYLDERYRVLKYRTTFPTLADTVNQVSDGYLSSTEIVNLVQTFAMHERGYIPPAYVVALKRLNQQFRLSLVIDIWAPKTVWTNYFKELGIFKCFEVISFSSDHGHVKPSAYGFLQVLNKMKLNPEMALFIGDSVRRDLGGAMAAGLDCVLVGDAQSDSALDSYSNLLTLCKEWQ